MIDPTARQTIQSVKNFTLSYNCQTHLHQRDLDILQDRINSSDRDKASVICRLIQTNCFMFVRDYDLTEGTQMQNAPPAIRISQVAFEALQRCAEDGTLPLLSRRRVERCSRDQAHTCKIICTVVTAISIVTIYWTTGLRKWIVEL